MKEEELDTMNKLESAWQSFLKLPIYHEDDNVDFEHSLHALQNIVMSRVAVRSNPERFINRSNQKPN